MKEIPIVDKERYENVQKQNYDIWKFIDDNKWVLFEFDKMCGDYPDSNKPSELVRMMEPIEAVEIFKKVYWGITPSQSSYGDSTSYSLKHALEDGYKGLDNSDRLEHSFYVSNGAAKGTMLLNGYLPKDPKELNWEFKMASTSSLMKNRFIKSNSGERSAFSNVKAVAENREDIEKGLRSYNYHRVLASKVRFY